MGYNKVSNQTQQILKSLEQKLEQNSAELENKIDLLKKDLAAARKYKLSDLGQDSIAQNIKNSKEMQKSLLKTGLGHLLEAEVHQVEEIHVKTFEKVYNQIDQLIGTKPNAVVFQHLKNLSALFSKAEEKETAHRNTIKSANSSLEQGLLENMIALENFNNQKILFDNILNTLSGVKISSQTALAVNDEYPLMRRRAQLANLCVETARNEWSESMGFTHELSEGLNMVSMLLSDAVRHYNLGVQILNGSPKKIEAARSMDTASRECIHEDVWDFATDTIYDRDIFGDKALKAHREKLTHQKARQLNKKIHKNIGPVVAGKSAARKM